MPVDFELYLITDRRQCGNRELVACVKEALEGGVRAVQLREKDLSARERYALAQELRALTTSFGALLFINNDAALARIVKADGVHLPHDGLEPDVCRTVLEPGMLIGASTHSIAEAEEAVGKGADFITFGPVYQTPSKAQYGPPVGVDSLRKVCQEIKVPVFGLGGISSSRIEEVLSAGGAGIALISAILASPNIKDAASELTGRLQSRHQAKVK